MRHWITFLTKPVFVCFYDCLQKTGRKKKIMKPNMEKKSGLKE